MPAVVAKQIATVRAAGWGRINRIAYRVTAGVLLERQVRYSREYRYPVGIEQIKFHRNHAAQVEGGAGSQRGQETAEAFQ